MRYIFIALIFALGYIQLGAQADSERMFFTLSIIGDEFICNNSKSLDEYAKCVEAIYHSLEVIKSKKISMNFEGKYDAVYEIELYEINLIDYKWKLLKYEGIDNWGWYRVYGYNENDFIHFYNRLLKKYLRNKSEILRVISTWEEIDTMFSKIDFQCLIKSSKTNNIKYDCMISNAYQQRSDLFIVNASKKTENDRKKEQLYTDHYARFSIRPYMGLLPQRSRGSFHPKK